MLHKASRIRGATIRATDGDIGTVEDFYLDDKQWTVTYLLIDTGKWLSGRRVLLSPAAVSGKWTMAQVPVTLTRDQVWHGPQADVQHLRGTKDVIGRHLHATDGEIGHVDDLLIGEETWRIRYLQVDTSNLIGGKWVIVSTDAVKGFDKAGAKLQVELTRAEVHASPTVDSIEVMVGTGETGPPFVIM